MIRFDTNILLKHEYITKRLNQVSIHYLQLNMYMKPEQKVILDRRKLFNIETQNCNQCVMKLTSGLGFHITKLMISMQ